MRKFLVTFVVLALVAAGAGNLRAQNAEDAKFKKFQDNFWDAYFKFFPTQGTQQGYVKYNDKLEDLSEGTITKFLDGIDAFNQELVSKMDITKLSPDVKIEAEMIRDFMDLTVLKLENSLFLIDNPLYYNDLFVESIRSLMAKAPGSPALAARAKALPGLIKKAKDNLKTPPREYTEAAAKGLPAVIDFFRTEVPKQAGSAPGLSALLPGIGTALDDYQKFVQGELLARSTGNFRTGEAHLRMLRLTVQGNLLIPDDISARSRADYNNLRKAMGGVSLPYFAIMYPSVNVDELTKQKGVDVALGTIIQGVLDKIKADHVGRDEFVGRIGQAAANLKSFITQAKLIDLPDDNLAVEPMPGYVPAHLGFVLSGPGAWDASGAYTEYVQPIPADWTADQANSFLEEANNYYIDFMAVQRVFPGTFVPTWFTRKNPSMTLRMCANKALLRGWPVPVEEMLVLSGYGNYDLRMRLNQLKLMLKNVIDFQMDFNVHEGTWSKDQVINHMVKNGFMTPQEAERRYNQIVLNPGEASLAYIGYQEISELEKDYRKLKGQAFSEKEFLQKILSFGAIPPRSLKAKLAQ